MTRRYYIQALDDAIAELRANLSGPDDFGVWSGLRSVLFWLYSFEEWCRNTDGSYYGHRDASPNGRALAGIIYIRGRAQHSVVDISELDWVEDRLFTLTDNGHWVPTTTYTLGVNGWQDVRTHTAQLVWPLRTRLPAASRSETRGRDDARRRSPEVLVEIPHPVAGSA